MIKEEEKTDGEAEEKKRTTEECQLAGTLCSLWVLSSQITLITDPFSLQ